MLFSSLTFLLVFLPLTLIVYFLSKDKYKNYILLLVSLVFYSWGEPKYIILMILSIVFNYYFGLLIDKFKKRKNLKKLILVLSIIFNIGLLLVFKYLGFIFNNISNIFSLNLPIINIMLPIGISFYTFQILSYVVDVYRKEVKVQKNIFTLATYITLFPQLIAGPIVRYQTVEKELKKRTHSLEKIYNGLKKFIVGLGKKIIIANNMALLADAIFNYAIEYDYKGIPIIIGVLAYTFQIYFDFSGYSDMAIGLGKIFGFEFLENFNYPYISQSITDFWRRWHISLSSFFRDYVYIPLGGNRVKKYRWIINILIVWALTGLWHGASWNFIIWGLYFAIILLIEKLFLSKILNKIPGIIRWLYSFILINIGWIIFRAENFELMIYVFKNIFVINKETNLNFLTNYYHLLNYVLYMIPALIFSFPIIKTLNSKFKDNKIYLFVEDMCLIGIFGICILTLVKGSYNPFIYFRF